jgi:hypothetical protein
MMMGCLWVGLSGTPHDVQVDAMQHANRAPAPLAAVVEVNVLKADLASRNLQLACVRHIRHLPFHGDRTYAILHCADILEVSRRATS